MGRALTAKTSPLLKRNKISSAICQKRKPIPTRKSTLEHTISHQDITMLPITKTFSLPLTEIEFHQIRAQGSGGQNVNKVSSSVHLRFNIHHSTLPEPFKERLLKLSDQRITKEGIIVIKAQQFRSFEKNREAALKRLQTLIRAVTTTPKKRKATRPSRASQKKRLDKKTQRGKTKALRKRVS